MMYLLDTNVISEMRKAQKKRAHPGVQRWSDGATESSLYLSAICILESETGILLMHRKDPAQATVLRDWLHGHILPGFAGRILGVTTEVALHCAMLHVPVTPPYRDSLIAATALVHGLTVVTRNVKDFLPMGCKVLNPWEG
jgi:predicted nucleic acid-binding protein